MGCRAWGTLNSGSVIITTLERSDRDWGPHSCTFSDSGLAYAAVLGKAQGAGSQEDRRVEQNRWLVALGRGPLAREDLGALTGVFSVFPECLEVLGACCEVLGDRCDLCFSWTCPEGSPGDVRDHRNVPRETKSSSGRSSEACSPTLVALGCL
ncbi:hypothetical protein CDL15_Pgr010148 [Punica granatum]|uniref:Uncharacterized protein n=1 Tax=Punica granatum TaxID=22663 RepID=A0A218Y230_PUNGR|nr:hypothetical protein CDL15_Pgr010148 [Punica granatum]